MATGFKSGGRGPGTRNKRTEQALARLEALDYDALDELVAIAREAQAQGDLATRLDVAQTLMKYSYPALKAIDLALAGGDAPLQLIVSTGIPADPPTESAEVPEDVRELMRQARRQLDG